MGGFHRNKKVRRISLEARGLLATAWSYASDHSTDGAVPIEMIEMWCGKRFRSILAELTSGSDTPGERPFISISEGDIDAHLHHFVGEEGHNISRGEWEFQLISDRKRKRKSGEFPTGNGAEFQTISGEFPPRRSDKDKDKDLSFSSRRSVEPPQTALAGPDPAPDPGARISELSARYPTELLAKVHDDVRLSRASSRMAPSVWLAVLEKLAAHPVDVVIRALHTFTDKYGAGVRDERYLLGIVRGEGKQARASPKSGGWQAPARASDFEDTEIVPGMFAKVAR